MAFLFPITYSGIIIYIVLSIMFNGKTANSSDKQAVATLISIPQLFGIILGLSIAFENLWIEITSTTTATYVYSGANISTITSVETLTTNIVSITTTFDYVLGFAVMGISITALYIFGYGTLRDNI